MTRRKATETGRLATLGDWLRHAERLYAKANLALGQVATNAHDEALYLLLRALGLPLDGGADLLAKTLTAAERAAARTILRRRVEERVPAAYLTKEAWLGEHRFYVDERAIIPRSYFLELIPRFEVGVDIAGVADPGSRSRRSRPLGANAPRPSDAKAWRLPLPLRIADVCTGSGCLAILLARQFPQATVDAIDLSPQALEVAQINVRAHRLGRRVKLHRSDVFDDVAPATYDLIISNPPYEPSARVDSLPPEFQREPRLALDGGPDGLTIIRKLLRQARERLSPEGVVLIEVGGLRRAMDREFAFLHPDWLHTEDGADCVCLIRAERL